MFYIYNLKRTHLGYIGSLLHNFSLLQVPSPRGKGPKPYWMGGAIAILAIAAGIILQRSKPTAHENVICLNMIVKNEMGRLPETFAAVVPHVDAYVVCDTGSTDGTQEYTREFFREHGVPGVVVQHEWEGYATNRNLCLREAEQQGSLGCSYSLILDADQVFVSEDSKLTLRDVPLTDDAYWLREISYGFSFNNMRLLTTKYKWNYTGRIHEHITYPEEEISLGSLPSSLYTKHDYNETARLDKDVEIMEEELEKDPKDPRTLFHLAKAYHSINLTRAVTLYHRRIAEGEIEGMEEVFYSKYGIAIILEATLAAKEKDEILLRKLHDLQIIKQPDTITFDEMVQAYEEAANDRPYRYEPWCGLAKAYWYRFRDSEQCYKYAMQGLQAGPITSETLLAHNSSIYCVHHLSCVCGYAQAHYDTALSSCNKVIVDLGDQPHLTNLETYYLGDANQIVENIEQVRMQQQEGSL